MDTNGNTNSNNNTNENVSAINEAVHALQDANAIMVFTGAGMSVESGISPFRGKGGIWNGLWGKMVLLYGATPIGWSLTPSITWSYFVSDFYRQIIQAKPHKGYYAITKLQNWFQRQQRDDHTSSCVVTMNVDGLHQMAGTRNVHEVHGTVMKLVCGSCGHDIKIPFENKQYKNDRIGNGWVKRGGNGTEKEEAGSTANATTAISEEEYAFDFFDKSSRVPRCKDFNNNATCTGKARPNVTLFGEGLPYATFRGVQQFARRNMTRQKKAVCIVIGTSSVVYPAAGIPEMCANQGSTLIEINPVLPTPLSNITDIQISMNAGDALETIVDQLLSL